MKPMDRQYIEQHDITRRYLNGKLTPEETEAFEVYLLENPEFVEHLQIDSLLTDGLQKVDMARSSKPHWLNKDMLKYWMPVNLGSIAATVAVVLLLMNSDNDKPMTDANVSPDIVYLENFRGADTQQTVTYSAADNGKIFTVTPNSVDVETFNLTISEEVNGSPLLLKPEIQVNHSGEIVLLIDKNQLPEGNYQLSLYDAGTNNLDSQFKFKVINK